MKSRTLVMIVTFLLIYIGLNGYIGWNGYVYLSHMVSGVFEVVYWSVFGLLAFSYIIAMMARTVLPHAVYILLKVIGAYWMAVLFFSLLLLPAADIAGLLLYAGGSRPERFVPWIGFIVIVIIVGLLLYSSRNAWSPIVRRYELTIAKPAGSLQKLRIAAASDLHLGTIVGKRHLTRLIEQMDKLKPDLILLPGDVLDDSLQPFVRENMADIMKRLSAPYGVYAVLGNHEYYGGHAEEYVGRMREIGITVLRDEAVKVLDSFYVIGRKDKAAEQMTKEGRLALDALLADIDKSLPLLLLDHQPHQLDRAAAAGIDVMLSGHTHRGQLAPSHWITRRLFELDWGYLRKGAMHAIVSSGFGTWGPPFRLGSRSEILDITITFEHKS